MDSQSITEKLEEVSRHEAEEQRRESEEQRRHLDQYRTELCAWEYAPQTPDEAGKECIDTMAAMEKKYESFWLMLGGYDGELSKEIILEKDKKVPGLIGGTLTAVISPGSYSPGGGGPDCGWGVTISFDEDIENGRYYSEREHGLWFNDLCDKIQHNGGQGYYPYYSWGSWWSREKAQKAQVYLEETLPRFEATFQWMLEAACDPELNPEVADRAQAYREELLAAA